MKPIPRKPKAKKHHLIPVHFPRPVTAKLAQQIIEGYIACASATLAQNVAYWQHSSRVGVQPIIVSIPREPKPPAPAKPKRKRRK